MRTFTCPQTGRNVICQPEASHSAIAFSAAKGAADLDGMLSEPYWTEAERNEIRTLADNLREDVIAHANAIMHGAF